MIKRIVNILLCLILATATLASLNQLPIRSVNGVNYYIYQVQPGEGKLAIAKKLGINIKDIDKYNPSAGDGLKAYQELLFPVPDNDVLKSDINNSIPETHTAKKGDSLYGICKKYGIDEQYFITLNPQAAEGIKADQIYRLKPVRDSALLPQTKSVKKQHKISRGESLYGIAQAYGCSVEDILSINPELDPSHYNEGQIINVPSDATDVTAKVASAFVNKSNAYTVKPNDTFYSIARNFGISIAQLQSANPGLNLLQEGMEIIIPDSCPEDNGISSGSSEQFISDFSSQEIPRIHTKEPIRIAIALPFNASVKPQPKHSRNYVDFFRGFMLAVDSFKIGGQPVAVYAYDTQNSADKAKLLRKDSLLVTSNVIISAGSLENCEDITKFGKENNITVLNIFSVRDTAYLSNRNAMQGNITSTDLIDLAIDFAKNNFVGYTPVILEVNGAKDKLSIANKIAHEMEKQGSVVKRIRLSEKPVSSDFKSLNANDKYLVIPSTSKIEFTKELLKCLTGENLDNGITLLGYPEWITLREKTTVHQLKKLNTYIYSRFAEPDEINRDRVDSSHKHWFGKGVSYGSPSMTLTGFDVGKYLVKILEENRGDFDIDSYSTTFEGLQYPFYFKRIENGGFVNKAAYMIHFTPEGEVENILIK